MINEAARCRVYDKIYAFMVEHGVNCTPTPVLELCTQLGIRVVTTRQLVAAGFNQAFLYRHWGNTDGVLETYYDARGGLHVAICINDEAHADRQRFTLYEELSHYILEHYQDDRCNRNSPAFHTAYYNNCEEEARIAAGILACPPPILYEGLIPNEPMAISCFCNIGYHCSNVRYEILGKYKQELTSRPLYGQLKQQYLQNASNIRMPPGAAARMESAY